MDGSRGVDSHGADGIHAAGGRRTGGWNRTGRMERDGFSLSVGVKKRQKKKKNDLKKKASSFLPLCPSFYIFYGNRERKSGKKILILLFLT